MEYHVMSIEARKWLVHVTRRHVRACVFVLAWSYTQLYIYIYIYTCTWAHTMWTRTELVSSNSTPSHRTGKGSDRISLCTWETRKQYQIQSSLSQLSLINRAVLRYLSENRVYIVHEASFVFLRNTWHPLCHTCSRVSASREFQVQSSFFSWTCMNAW